MRNDSIPSAPALGRIGIYKKLYAHTKSFGRLFFVLLCVSIYTLALELVYPVFYRTIVDKIMIAGDMLIILPAAAGYILVFLLVSAGKIADKSVANRIFLKLIPRLKIKILSTYLKMEPNEISKFDAGDLEGRADKDADLIETFFKTHIFEFIYAALNVAAIGTIMFFIDLKLSLFGLFMVPLSFLFTNVMGKKAEKVWEKYRGTLGVFEDFLHRTFQNWKEIKSNNLEESEEKTFQSYRFIFAKLIWKSQVYWTIKNTFIGFKSLFIVRMNVYFLGGMLIIWDQLSLGEFLMFMVYYEQFYANITTLTESMFNLKKDAPFIDRAVEMLNKHIEEKPAARFSGNEMELREVNFSYENSNDYALLNTSLRIDESGEIAVAGRSGCGKTTLAKLLVGLHSPCSGEISIGGVDIRGIDSRALNKKISMVMQEPMFFNLTIRENLKFAKRRASDRELDEVCKKADIFSFIDGLPNRYDTVIGEKGIKLSGGQKQRLAIARILLRNPDIIVFDEATSALDYESEKSIVSAVFDIAKTKTVILIAHRLSTIIHAKRVILMENGTVTASGSHSGLKGKNKLYDELFEKQYHIMN